MNDKTKIAYVTFDYIDNRLIVDAKASEQYFTPPLLGKKIFAKEVLRVLGECVNDTLQNKYVSVPATTQLAVIECELKGADTLLITAKTYQKFFTTSEAKECFPEKDILRQLGKRTAQGLGLQLKIQTTYVTVTF